jgi:NAD(P)-dependent dehydrogenase (short-subunit alcohol dehydrogenase family)
VAEIVAQGGRAISVRADISVPADVEAVAAVAERSYGGLDTWINMAAVMVYAPFEQTTPEEWQRVVSVDLLGYAYGMRAALPLLKRRGAGAIVNVSSVEGKVALPYSSAYAAAKAGVIALSDAVRIELRHDGVPVSVTNIMPASMDTPLFDHARSKLGVKPRPFPPVYPPERVVGAVLYAAEHPVRELVVGGAGRLLIGLRALAPGLTEAFLARTGYRMQTTPELRSAQTPSTLIAPLPDDRITGRRALSPRKIRPPRFFSRHPRLGLVAALAVGQLAFRRWRSA